MRNKGENIVLKILCVGLLISYIFLFTLSEVKKFKSESVALREILSFISSVKAELRFKLADIETLFLSSLKDDFKYITFCENRLMLKGVKNREIIKSFEAFTSKIGTTDSDGQIALCEEYYTRFNELLNEFKLKEKSKIQVNTALGVLGAVTLIVFFL